MRQTYRESFRNSHSNELEHRLTVVEVEIKHVKSDHGQRITVLEGKPQPGPRWTPRDITLAAAGVFLVAAALAEKIGWTPMFALLVKLYGVK